jgi:hypothetical protein
MYFVYKDTQIRDRLITKPHIIFYSSSILLSIVVAWFCCGANDHCRIVRY